MPTRPMSHAFIALYAAGLLACYPATPLSEQPPPDVCDTTPETPEGAQFADVTGVPFGAVKPNVMLLVDRSASMNDTGICESGSCQTKWDQLLALGPYLEQIKPHVRMGLSVYPAPGQGPCGVENGILVPISEDHDVDQQILEQLEATSPGGATPTDAALYYAANYGGLDAPDRENILVLLTDGRPTCACDGDTACAQAASIEAVEALRYDYEPPIKVYVIGFGASAREEAEETLTLMAEAAGTARNVPGEAAYHQADSVEELVRRVYEVANEIKDPCAFEICDQPDAQTLVAALDGRMVERCDEACADGFSYEPSLGRVTFEGRACDDLTEGTVHEIWFGERQDG